MPYIFAQTLVTASVFLGKEGSASIEFSAKRAGQKEVLKKLHRRIRGRTVRGHMNLPIYEEDEEYGVPTFTLYFEKK